MGTLASTLILVGIFSIPVSLALVYIAVYLITHNDIRNSR